MHITSEQPPQISESDSIPEHMASQHVNPSLKVWQAWPGRHIFCCDGRVMVGPDIGITIFAAALTTGTCITFWVFVCTTFPVPAFLSGALLFCTTMFFLAMTATTDPGIIPSNHGMDQAQIAACAQAQRTVDVNGVSIPLKWCRTCHIFRPPRAAHCSECNVCVERFDHHCPWMGQCIGKRNYRYFLGFVNSCCLLCTYTLGLSAVAIYRAVTAANDAIKDHDFFGYAMRRSPTGVALVGFCSLILLCNRTTSEEIKEPYGLQNPFDLGVCRNCDEACCETRGSPRVSPRAQVIEPERLDTCGLIDATRNEANPCGENNEVVDVVIKEEVDGSAFN